MIQQEPPTLVDAGHACTDISIQVAHADPGRAFNGRPRPGSRNLSESRQRSARCGSRSENRPDATWATCGKSPAIRDESDTRYTDLFVSVNHEIRPLVHEPASLFKQVSPRIGPLGGVAKVVCQRRFTRLPTSARAFDAPVFEAAAAAMGNSGYFESPQHGREHHVGQRLPPETREHQCARSVGQRFGLPEYLY